MNAGRDLDALVAEKVMGMVDAARIHLTSCLNMKSDSPSYCETRGAILIRCEIPAFSTDIAAAWEVMERLRNLGYGPSEIWGMKACFRVRLFLPGQGAFVEHQATSAPLAICRAALNAVGVEE